METFGTDDIRRAIGERSFSRGQDYFECGMVQSVEFKTPCRIHGRVSGSGSNVYSVSAILTFEANAMPGRVEGHCSCPVGFNCKHVAALLLAARGMSERRTGAHGPADPALLPGEVSRWLDLWPGRIAPALEVRPPGPPAPGQEHLFYVIHRDRMRGMCITPYRAYLKKDETIGSNFQEFNRRSSWGRKNLTVQDAAILGKLDFFADGGVQPSYDWPDGEELTGLVREIVETGRARAGEIRGMTLSWSPPRRLDLAWEVGPAGEQSIVARDGSGSTMMLLPFPSPFFLDPATGETGVAETSLPPRMASWFASAPPVPHESVGAVGAKLSRVGQHAPVPRLQRVEERTDVRPEPVLTLYGCEQNVTLYAPGEYRRGPGKDVSAVFPCARLEIVYEGAGRRLRPGEIGGLQDDSDGRPAVIRRDPVREAGFREALVQAAKRHGGKYPGALRHDIRLPPGVLDADFVFPPLRDEDEGEAAAAGIGFVSRTVPALRAEGWRVEIDKTWPFRIYEGPVAFSTALESADADWFSLALSLEANGQTFDISPIVLQIVDALPVNEWGQLEDGFDVDRHLAGRVIHARFEDGTYLAIDGARFARFAEAFLEAQGLLGFHRAEAGRLFELAEALEGCGAPWTGGRELLDLGARLRSLSEAPELPAPAALHGELRPYQRAGYGWLRALSDSGFGGMLADDMGLGKTVQALALLAHRHLEEKTDRPSLVVVPTSLVGNWKREAARFVPDLKLLVLHGPDRRQRFSEIPNHHLVLTTYPLVNRDYEALFGHDYDTAILDEAQTVKNPAAAVSKRIRDVRARQRLALTGTPLENNLGELWSLYDWLIPGLLGNRKSFTADYRTPIEKRGDRARQRLLSTRIKPFLMRRTKEQVARDLPEKTVIDELIPLEGGQAALYESIRTAMDARIRDAIAARGLAASRITILDALLKLRQVCCDPRLVRLDSARKVTESAKRARLFALLEELVAEGRKILIFSQFVKMLRLIEGDVAARGWDYAMLHGSTKDRDVQVSNFQSGNLPLFLISLKAGGTGLNLTAADTVIVYDPWWNPAVERQAMDRAHRIGQDKPVFVHRLIAEDTVEAAIQKMQIRKQALADALFEGTGEGPLALTEEDIDALFGPG